MLSHSEAREQEQFNESRYKVIDRLIKREETAICGGRMASTEGVREEAQRGQFDPVKKEYSPTPGNGAQQSFGTGATRSTSEGKVDYEGHIDPDVLAVYGDYMNRHRMQRNGQLRGSDNWQSGIPIPAYMKSLVRHLFEMWRMYRGYPVPNQDADGRLFTFDEVACAILFNAMGLIREMSRRGMLRHTVLRVEMRKQLEHEIEEARAKAAQEIEYQKARAKSAMTGSGDAMARSIVGVSTGVPTNQVKDMGLDEGTYRLTVERERY